MGIAIHYRLQTDLESPTDVRQLVENLRRKALGLPFQQVGQIVEFVGAEAADYEQFQISVDPEFRLLMQAVEIIQHNGGPFDVKPEYVIAFTVNPNDGFDAASFGFARHPVQIQDHRGGHAAIVTNLKGWSWDGYCYTDRVSKSDRGGMEHFLRFHLAIVHLLDDANELGIVRELMDEGGYFEIRDIQALAAEVTRWKGLLARLSDEAVEEAIANLPNFEYLKSKE